MNKRQSKKKIKKKKSFHGYIYADGNKGGDFLEIYDNCDGTIRLTSGHCCVMSIDKIVPVEFLTAIIQKVMLEHDCNVLKVIDGFDWCQEFKESLKEKTQ